MKTVYVIQPSLRECSYTDIVCKHFIKECRKREDITVKKIDLRKRNLEWCYSNDIHDYNIELQRDYASLKKADVIIFWFPVYHFAISWVLKNYIDIMGDALVHKRIDFLVTALMRDCDMAHEHIFKSLVHKFDIQKVLKDTVYILDRDMKNGNIMNLFERKKIQDLVKNI